MQGIPIVDPDLPLWEDPRPAKLEPGQQRLAAAVGTTLFWLAVVAGLLWWSTQSTLSSLDSWPARVPWPAVIVVLAALSYAMFVASIVTDGPVRRLRCGAIAFLGTVLTAAFLHRLASNTLDLTWLMVPATYGVAIRLSSSLGR